MEYFKSLTQKDLIALISSTKHSIFLCMPSLHDELADALSYLSFTSSFEEHEIAINILVDFDAQTFRQGYGNYESVGDLIKGGFEIKSLKDNRISFIIVDEIGYYLFMESRSLIPADKETINAVKIDPVSIVRLKKFFFSSYLQSDFEDELTNAIIEESKRLEQGNTLVAVNIAPVEIITEEKLNDVVGDLKRNPPLNPDYKRIVDFYSNKFQYVKLKFKGSNIQHRKIEIPANALPIIDVSLKKKLETKLNLFDQDEINKSFSALEKLKDGIAEIRKKYLKKVKSREESLLNKLEKNDFDLAISEFKKQIEEIKDKELKSISTQINETKTQLQKDLQEFLKANPKVLLPEDPKLWQNHGYVENLAKGKAEEVIHRIRWPQAHLLTKEFQLEVQFSDITFEDLRNENFIKELKEIGLISANDQNQLAEFSRGIRVD